MKYLLCVWVVFLEHCPETSLWRQDTLDWLANLLHHKKQISDKLLKKLSFFSMGETPLICEKEKKKLSNFLFISKYFENIV